MFWRGLRIRGRAWACAVCLFALSHTQQARAEEEAVRVHYSAPESCPDEAAFVARVRGRTEHGRFAAPGELARTFDIALVAAGSGFSGQIAFTDADGRNVQRRVASPSCDEVASSLALIMALSLDDRVVQSEARVTAGEASASAAPRETPKKEATPTAPVPKIASQNAAATERGAARVASAPRSSLRFDLGFDAVLESWVLPDVAPSFGVFVALGARTSGLSARLSGFRVQQTAERSLGSAELALDFVRAEVCPFTLVSLAALRLAPCAAFDVGSLRVATASSTMLPAGRAGGSQAWLVAVGLLRLEYELGANFVLNVDGEVGAPFVRRQYELTSTTAGSESVFDVPGVGAGTKLGLALRFP